MQITPSKFLRGAFNDTSKSGRFSKVTTPDIIHELLFKRISVQSASSLALSQVQKEREFF
jgi:hypothetical protein